MGGLTMGVEFWIALGGYALLLAGIVVVTVADLRKE